MSTYTEIELRCDGVEGDPYGCDDVIYDLTAARARATASDRGWAIKVRGGRDLCPKHRATGGHAGEKTGERA